MSRKPKRHEVLDLLLALRREGITCTTVTCAGVTLDGVVDTKAHGDAPAAKPEPRLSMWEQQVEAIKNQPANAKDAVPEEALLE
jgi:hypothetical protein